MRTLFRPIALAGLVVAAFAWDSGSRPGQALIVYQWCGAYSGGSGATNCGFASYQQCRDAIAGLGGSCYQNPLYNPQPDGAPAPRRGKPRNNQQ